MKKLIALLLVLVMALSVVACTPNSSSGDSNAGNNNSGNNSGNNQTPETPAVPAGPNDDLVLDENDMGICPVCGGDPVQWTPVFQNIGELTEPGAKHYYLVADELSADNGPFLWARTKNIDVCLHLNNKNIDVHGFIRTGSDNDLNIMGKGSMNFLADATTYPTLKDALFYIETANLTIYGGTFKSTAGKPIVGTPGVGNPKIKLTGDATFSLVSCTLGALTIDEDVVIDKLEVGNSTHADKKGEMGKLWVAKTFTGEVKSFTFPGAIADNKVPMDYAAAMGTFTGKITTADGVALTGATGSLTVKAS